MAISNATRALIVADKAILLSKTGLATKNRCSRRQRCPAQKERRS